MTGVSVAFTNWMYNIYDHLPAPISGMIVTIAAVIFGALVGMERGKREKPAGLRTMMLICLGACIFTQAGHLLGERGADPARIAAQVVSGVGFLGAGAIIQSRGMVTGFTTAAAIWVVAAVGVVVGTGHVVAAAFFTLLTLLTLAAERLMESAFYGRCEWSDVRVIYNADQGRTRLLVVEALDEGGVSSKNVRFQSEGEGLESALIHYCNRHRSHRTFLCTLARLPAVREIISVSGAMPAPSE